MNLVVPSNKGLLWHLPLQPNPHLGIGCKMMGHPTPWVSGDRGGGGLVGGLLLHRNVIKNEIIQLKNYNHWKIKV